MRPLLYFKIAFLEKEKKEENRLAAAARPPNKT
jgi:hypothetical protein